MLVTIYRTAILFLLIIVCLRIMGKRQIGQLQTSELVTTVMISELAVIPIQDSDEPIIQGIVPILVLVALEVLMQFIMLKSDKFRTIACGRPIAVIERGRIIQKNMKKLRMSTEDLCEQLRQNDVFAIKDADYAFIETNGHMSVLKKAEADHLTPRQAGVKVKPAELEVVAVTDGVLASKSIELCKKDIPWVLDRIEEGGYKLDDVFIMTISEKGQFKIIPKDKVLKNKVSGSKK